MKDKDVQNTTTRRMLLILSSIFIILFFFLVFNYHFWDDYSIRKEFGTVGYQEQEWVLERQDTKDSKKISLPWFQQLERGQLYTLSTTLTYDGSKEVAPYMYMHFPHMFCRVYLDDELLFSCMPGDFGYQHTLKSPGFIFRTIPLPDDCCGKTMRIELLPMLTADIDYSFPVITFGDMESTVYHLYQRYIPFHIIIVICMVLGISSLLYSSMVFRGAKCREGFAIGAFALIFMIYLVTECEFDVYFIGNPYYTYIFNYISFSILPISLLAFMRERLSEKYYKILSIMIGIHTLVFVVEMVLHFTGIWDFREFIPILHILDVAEILLVLILILVLKNKKKKYSFLLQILPLLIGVFIDGFVYWLHIDIGTSNASFTIIGVVFFLSIEIYHIFQSGIAVYGKSVLSKTYQQMAYKDALTGIANRRAYEEEIEKIESKKKTYRSMIVVSADVNKLKFVNDNFGHAAGDQLICGAAQIMKDEFGKHGKVFRTGGDEFIIFLYNVDVPRYEEMLKSARKKIEDFNQKNEFVMSIAIGYEIVKNQEVINATIKADHKMYEEKIRQKMQRS